MVLPCFRWLFSDQGGPSSLLRQSMLDCDGVRGILYVFVGVFVFSLASHHFTSASVIIGTDATGPIESEFYCLHK